jgi:hypothetical protein
MLSKEILGFTERRSRKQIRSAKSEIRKNGWWGEAPAQPIRAANYLKRIIEQFLLSNFYFALEKMNKSPGKRTCVATVEARRAFSSTTDRNDHQLRRSCGRTVRSAEGSFRSSRATQWARLGATSSRLERFLPPTQGSSRRYAFSGNNLGLTCGTSLRFCLKEVTEQ